jgi:hypothetical protein
MVTNPKAIMVAMEAGTTIALTTVAMVAAAAEATAEAVMVAATALMAAMVAATAAMAVATGPAVNSAGTGGTPQLIAATALIVTTAATIHERETRLPQATTTTRTGTWILVQRIISQVIWNVYTCTSATEELIKSRWLMVWVCLFRTLVIQT